MSIPRVVVFDLGKVLVDFDYSIAARQIAAQGKLSAEEVQRVIDQSALLFRYESAGMTTQEFFHEVRRMTGFCGNMAGFAETFADIFTEIPAMTAFHQSLREQNIPTYIFSNTNELAVQHIRRKFPFFRNFTGYILSYEHASMKPEPAIYAAVEKICGWSGSDILYIDDREENIRAGEARAWRTIWHHNPAQTFSEAAKLGLAYSPDVKATA